MSSTWTTTQPAIQQSLELPGHLQGASWLLSCCVLRTLVISLHGTAVCLPRVTLLMGRSSRDILIEVRVPITPVSLVLLVVGKILHSLQQPDNMGG